MPPKNNKKQKVEQVVEKKVEEEVEEDLGEIISPEEQERLQALEPLQEKLEAADEEFNREAKKLRAKFEIKKAPIYKERNDTFKTIEHFWKRAISNFPLLGMMLDENDEDEKKALDALTSLDVITEEAETDTFKIVFHFAENPYFSNTELWKRYVADESGDSFAVTFSPINWKAGKNLCAKPAKKGDKGKKRPVEEIMPKFFDFFGDNDQDGEVGEAIRNGLWRDPVQFFIGMDMMLDEDEDEDFEDEDDE
eukprot:GILI01001078.1.p1 GENE.GILI01001078.1~~GILI01001078.1.p1  ORF type:complete len:265 (+),score=122.29 GILI01001078.1:45-797(+)